MALGFGHWVFDGIFCDLVKHDFFDVKSMSMGQHEGICQHISDLIGQCGFVDKLSTLSIFPQKKFIEFRRFYSKGDGQVF